MTSSGPGGPQDPANHQETAQWWATPPTGTDAGQPVVGADPTMLNYGTAGAQYTPPAQAFPPAQGYQSAPNYQAAPAYQQPAQPGYAQPQFSPPQQPPMSGGYNYAPQPPSGGGGKAGWIIGIVVGLVVIVGIGIGVIALTSKDKPLSPLGDDKKKTMDGNYSMDKVGNACSLIDPTVLTKWSSTSKGNPEHSETKPTDYSGGRLSCTAGYSGQSSTSKYHTNEADITLDVDFNSAYGKPDYDSWKTYDTGTTGSGRSSGDITGLGSQAYWHAETRDYSSFTVLDYTVAAQDSNVSVKVKISVDRGSGETITKDDVAQIAKDQVQKALNGLRKK
ncbi:hypothetical protein GFY24_00610 [Nocardia sp. SYP-A9097]|uniref:hypothetical protein n=1 Tax=Nocardia sp. SYP-A9097 TaxID=2663237 RepID=UPI00129A6FD4|nr:hypothetical protein [Nocardia sp. SYP-A9097]MRH85979.1 hypothetical protein [Nocardia sp. SYP-A9097]